MLAKIRLNGIFACCLQILRCPVCELSLDGHAELYNAALGDEYSVADHEDPLEY